MSKNKSGFSIAVKKELEILLEFIYSHIVVASNFFLIQILSLNFDRAYRFCQESHFRYFQILGFIRFWTEVVPLRFIKSQPMKWSLGVLFVEK